jgi:hypothetical protein
MFREAASGFPTETLKVFVSLRATDLTHLFLLDFVSPVLFGGEIKS